MEYKLPAFEAMLTLDILKWFIENGPEDKETSFVNTKNLTKNIIRTLEMQMPPSEKQTINRVG